MAGSAGSVDRVTDAKGSRRRGAEISSIDGTMEGACSIWASLSSNSRKRCGISKASGLRTSRSRSPISSQIARQWAWSSAMASGLRFGMARLNRSQLFELDSIWLVFRRSKLPLAICVAGKDSAKSRRADKRLRQIDLLPQHTVLVSRNDRLWREAGIRKRRSIRAPQMVRNAKSLGQLARADVSSRRAIHVRQSLTKLKKLPGVI